MATEFFDLARTPDALRLSVRGMLDVNSAPALIETIDDIIADLELGFAAAK